MNVKNVEKENGSAKVTVEIAKDEFQTALDKAYAKIRKDIMIPGFRKGKAPRKFVERMYGSQVFYEDAVNEIFPEIYKAAITEQEIKAVGQPSVTDMQTPEDGSVVLTVSTELYPEVTLGEYKGIEVPKESVSISKAEVDAELARMQERNARIETVDREAKTGDTVVLDFEGFVDGKPFDGGKAEGYTLTLGSGAFIPGFEDQLVGMEAETDGEVNVTFPEQYDPKLAGKDATFKVKIHAVREPQLPELDDEFAKDVSEFDTLDEYKADLKAKTLERKTEGAEADFKNAVISKAIENMEVSIPESMIAEKIDEFLMNYADSMGARGMSRENLLKAMGLDDATFSAMMRPAAERQVQADLLLEAVAKAENIEATEEDKNEFYDKLAADYGEEAEKIKGMIDENLMVQDIVHRKAADVMYDSAVKTEPKPDEETPAADEAPAEETGD